MKSRRKLRMLTIPSSCSLHSSGIDLETDTSSSFDALPDSEKKGKTYYEWIKEGYYRQYESWMPWIEDQYLKWFTKDNKTSYAAKRTKHSAFFRVGDCG